MLAKEFGRQPLRRCFVSDRFGAVLAKLGDLAMIVRARPGAALAIESVFLINVEQRFEAAADTHLADGETRRLNHRRPTGGPRPLFTDLGVAIGGKLRTGCWILLVAVRLRNWRARRRPTSGVVGFLRIRL